MKITKSCHVLMGLGVWLAGGNNRAAEPLRSPGDEAPGAIAPGAVMKKLTDPVENTVTVQALGT